MGLFGNNAGVAFASAMQYLSIVGNAVMAFNKYKVDSDESELFEALTNQIVNAANTAGVNKPLSDAQLHLLKGHVAGIIDIFEKD